MKEMAQIHPTAFGGPILLPVFGKVVESDSVSASLLPFPVPIE